MSLMRHVIGVSRALVVMRFAGNHAMAHPSHNEGGHDVDEGDDHDHDDKGDDNDHDD